MKLKPTGQGTGLGLSKHKALLIFIILLVIVVPLRSNAQDYLFTKVPLPKGKFEYMGNVVQDKSGYLWMASGKGLVRYDGYQYKIYLNDPRNLNSLAQDHLERIFIDNKGTIWIATWTKGLDRFDPASGKFTHFRHDSTDKASISHDLVRAILQDHEGTLWIGTHGGLDRFDPKKEKFIHYRNDPDDPASLSCDRVRVLLEDRHGTLWVGTGSTWGEGNEVSKDEGGLNRFERSTGKFKRYLYDPSDPQKLLNNKVQALFEDSKGVFWVGTAGDGLHSLDRETGLFQRYPYDASTPQKLSRPKVNSIPFPDYITFINEDATGCIWIGTMGNGLVVYDRKSGKCAPYKIGNGLVSEAPTAMYTLRDNNAWVSTWPGNVYSMDPFNKRIPQFDLGTSVFAITGGPSGTLWLCTAKGLIRKNLVTGGTKIFSHDPGNPNSISSNTVWSISKDLSGALWVGTSAGIDRFDPTSNQFSHINMFGNNSNTFIYYGVFGDSLWMIRQSAVTLFNTKTYAFTDFCIDLRDAALYAGDIRAVHIDRERKIWMGTFLQGVILLDPVTGEVRRFLRNIPDIYQIFEDSNGTIWIFSDEGLFFKKPKEADFTRFINGSGISLLGYGSGIIEDNQKNIYLNGINGIFRINLNNFETVIFEISQDDPYKNNSDLPIFNIRGTTYKDEDGTLFFGTGTGYFAIHPGDLKINPIPPQISISNIRVNGKSLLSDTLKRINSTSPDRDKISLTHDQNNIVIEFVGIHYGRPENNQHLYMLENYEQEWHTVLKDKIAAYSNLPPGDYIFRIKAANSDGVWSDKSIKIFVSPPWWKTWWAYLLYFLILTLTVILFDRFQRRRIVARERERSMEKELSQAKEIEKAYSSLKKTQTQLIHSEKMASLGELTAGIAHEIQNPLNFVNNFSDVNKELLSEMKTELDRGNTEVAKSIANDIIENEEKIRHHGTKADAIVKSMLQHSRSSSGQKEPTDINELAQEYLKLSYNGMRLKNTNFNVNLETDFDPLSGEISIVPQEIGRVLLNLYNNAFYSVTEKTLNKSDVYIPTVHISTKRNRDILEIKVKDNGFGIAANIRNKIFQPFFTTKPTGQGTGLGLSLSYDIVKSHGGELNLESIEGEGASFLISLPVNGNA